MSDPICERCGQPKLDIPAIGFECVTDGCFPEGTAKAAGSADALRWWSEILQSAEGDDEGPLTPEEMNGILRGRIQSLSKIPEHGMHPEYRDAFIETLRGLRSRLPRGRA